MVEELDARELTEKYWKQKEEIADLQKRVEELEAIVDKMQLKVNDMSYDVMMLERSKK